MAGVIELTNIAYEARDQAMNEVAALRAQADREQAAYEQEVKEARAGAPATPKAARPPDGGGAGPAAERPPTAGRPPAAPCSWARSSTRTGARRRRRR